MDIYEIRQALSGGKTVYDLPLRVAYYARVSTDKDEQLHSLSAQVAYYEAYIRENPNWMFAGGYVDEGLSGTSVKKREQFLRMIRDAHAGEFDFIVTKEISRFSRNTLDSIQYTQEFLRCGVGVLFQADNINTLMPDAELRLTIMSSIAQDEVRKISERVKFGFKRAIEKGIVLGSNRIWGYRKREGKLVVVEEEAEIVRLIFDLYANHRMGIRTLCTYLTDRGYLNSNGNPFSFGTIRGILSNPKYKGYYCGGKSSKIDYKLKDVKHFAPEQWVVYKDEETVPPIVSQELWEKANQILARRSEKQRAKDRIGYHNKYPYSGKILCGIHKTSYYRSLYRYENGDKEVWQCQEYVKNGKSGCKSPKLYTTEADTVVRCALETVPFCKADFVHDLIQMYTDIGGKSRTEGKIARCRASVEEILRRKDRLLDLTFSGHITDGEFSVRNERFNSELENLRGQLERLEEEQLKQQNTMKSVEILREAINRELDFETGFSPGVIDALVDYVEGWGSGGRDRIQVCIRLKGLPGHQVYLIQRRRGKPSVCTGIST